MAFRGLDGGRSFKFCTVPDLTSEGDLICHMHSLAHSSNLYPRLCDEEATRPTKKPVTGEPTLAARLFTSGDVVPVDEEETHTGDAEPLGL